MHVAPAEDVLYRHPLVRGFPAWGRNEPRPEAVVVVLSLRCEAGPCMGGTLVAVPVLCLKDAPSRGVNGRVVAAKPLGAG